jgi:hypothetical protein
MTDKLDHIKLTPGEVRSGYTRQQWAEGLIPQLPPDHEGRNSWLLNYGTSAEAQEKRQRAGLAFDPEFQAAPDSPS